MKNTIWIVPIEPLDNRYTKQWFENIPAILKEKTDNYNILQIEVEGVGNQPTKGAFLNFSQTNIYKARQSERVSWLFHDGLVRPGDKFLVTDAWNFVIPAIKYMSDLLDIPVEIHGIWHAGAYDPTDILGLKMQKPWPYEFEKACFHACDFNYFGTFFHRKMFLDNLELWPYQEKAIRSGQPHDMIVEAIVKHAMKPKENIILWPHRYNQDKQPDIAKDLAKHLPEYKFIFSQKEMNLTKEDYYALMGKCKAVFSCSLHENLGICMMEGVLAGAVPIVPNRASYKEMYMEDFKYPSHWTSSWESYTNNREDLVNFIRTLLDRHNDYNVHLQSIGLSEDYLHAKHMIRNLIA